MTHSLQLTYSRGTWVKAVMLKENMKAAVENSDTYSGGQGALCEAGSAVSSTQGGTRYEPADQRRLHATSVVHHTMVTQPTIQHILCVTYLGWATGPDVKCTVCNGTFLMRAPTLRRKRLAGSSRFQAGLARISILRGVIRPPNFKRLKLGCPSRQRVVGSQRSRPKPKADAVFLRRRLHQVSILRLAIWYVAFGD